MRYSALTVFRCNENKIPEKSCILKIKIIIYAVAQNANEFNNKQKELKTANKHKHYP